MQSARKDEAKLEDLAGKIERSVTTILGTLPNLTQDISLYHMYHLDQFKHRDPLGGNMLDRVYKMFEEQSKECQRLWISIRAMAEERASTTGITNNPFPSTSRAGFVASSSSFKYQSAHGEGESTEIDKEAEERVVPSDVNPVEVKREPLQPPPPTVASQYKKFKPPKVLRSALRSVIDTPDGSTSRQPGPIPTALRPASRDSLQSSNQQAGPSTAQTTSSGVLYSSAEEYWVPRKAIGSKHLQMDDDQLFVSLDCVGPPFQVNGAMISRNVIPATQSDLRVIYGLGLNLTHRIAPEMLATHGFNDFLTPDMTFHPFLPPRPGWPGLILQPGDDSEAWLPERGAAFRVVIRCEPGIVEYVGQYEMLRLGDIPLDVWKRQPATVKKNWNQVLGGGASGRGVIARIDARKKLKREPSSAELMKYSDMSDDAYTTLARDLEDDIDKAFCVGDEVIAVWGMKCVGYDFKFENHLARSPKAKEPLSSSSVSAKRRKPVVGLDGDVDHMGEDEGEEQPGADSRADDPSPPKRLRSAKGKAKQNRSDLS